MGRAGRPQGLPPELQELREEGLPDGWERYWHGERTSLEVPPSELASSFSAEDLLRLSNGPLPRSEWFEMMSEDTWKEGAAEASDLLMQALWKQEELRLQSWIGDYEEATGKQSVLRDIDLGKVRAGWMGTDFASDLRSWIADDHQRLPSPSILHHMARALSGEASDLVEGDSVEDFWNRFGEELHKWREADTESYRHFIREEAAEMIIGSQKVAENILIRSLEEDLLQEWAPGALSTNRLMQVMNQQGGMADYFHRWRGEYIHSLAGHRWREQRLIASGKDLSDSEEHMHSHADQKALALMHKALSRHFQSSLFGNLLSDRNKSNFWRAVWRGYRDAVAEEAARQGIDTARVIYKRIEKLTVEDVRALDDNQITLEELIRIVQNRS